MLRYSMFTVDDTYTNWAIVRFGERRLEVLTEEKSASNLLGARFAKWD